jgi:hypothetical protein
MAGQPVTFTSTLTGGTGNVPQIYHWTVSTGRIIGGQGTNTIKVDTSGLEGQSLKASLSMAGYEEDCSASCTIEFPVPITCRKFDEFPDISRNDEKARLDNFAIELQNDPTSTAYVIVHPASNGRSGTAQARATRIVDYVVNSRQFDARRIVTLIGPARSELAVELRTLPAGCSGSDSVGRELSFPSTFGRRESCPRRRFCQSPSATGTPLAPSKFVPLKLLKNHQV